MDAPLLFRACSNGRMFGVLMLRNGGATALVADSELDRVLFGHALLWLRRQNPDPQSPVELELVSDAEGAPVPASLSTSAAVRRPECSVRRGIGPRLIPGAPRAACHHPRCIRVCASRAGTPPGRALPSRASSRAFTNQRLLLRSAHDQRPMLNGAPGRTSSPSYRSCCATHNVAGTSESPVPFMRKHHARITSLHLKDRKKGTNTGVNMPWGQGDTPNRRSAAADEERAVAFPRLHRARVPGSGRFDAHRGSRQVRRLREGCAHLVLCRRGSARLAGRD